MSRKRDPEKRPLCSPLMAARCNERLTVERRPYQERFLHRMDEHDAVWAERLVGVAYLLDMRLGWMAPDQELFQELADMIDYGPQELSPRDLERIGQITQAFDNWKADQAKRCARGEHIYGVGPHKCWACGEPRYGVIDGGGTK